MHNVIFLKKPNRRCGSTAYLNKLAMKFHVAPVLIVPARPNIEQYHYDYMNDCTRYYRIDYDTLRINNMNERGKFFQHLEHNNPPIFLMDYNGDEAKHVRAMDTFNTGRNLIIIEDTTELVRKENQQEHWTKNRWTYANQFFVSASDYDAFDRKIYLNAI